MAYRVYADGNLICSPNNEQTALDSPTLTLEANKAGTFSFTMLPDHPFYDRINLRTSLIDVYQDWELIFEGVPVSESSDFYNRKTFECEGDLAFLNDTIQRLAVHEGMTPQTLLARYLAAHNEQADADKQFQVGVVTVQGSNLYRYTNYQTTMTEISEDLIENFGGYLRVRHEGGVRYLDYLAESPRASAQSIRIGKNLIDLSKNLNTLDICTVLIPLGAKTGTLDNIDTRLDIKTVNGGLDYLVGTGAAYYGNIWRTQTWDDVTVASNLKAKGQVYLDSAQWANLVIEATALDLGLTEDDVEQFRVLDTIRVVSEPHGLDRTFMLTKLQIDLNHPGDTQVTLGHDERLSLSKQTAQAAAKIEQTKTEVIASAAENTRQILDAATDGAIQIFYNSYGVAYELRINNSQNPATATKWWRYNSAGWGYTADGGQTYTIAATMDGAFLADIITAGILQSNNGDFWLNMATGAALLKNVKITGGSIDVSRNETRGSTAFNILSRFLRIINTYDDGETDINAGSARFYTPNNNNNELIILANSISASTGAGLLSWMINSGGISFMSGNTLVSYPASGISSISGNATKGRIRFTQGKVQIAWNTVSWTGKLNQAWGSGIYESSSVISLGNWQETFNAAPAVAYSASSSGNLTAWVAAGTSAPSATSAGSIVLERANLSDVSQEWTVRAIAVGTYS